ncbi:MAG: primosomal protein N' [Verrucomicrobia bacterium]|nr:primosomal protein N' [Verrucomicrobiota bacterium]
MSIASVLLEVSIHKALDYSIPQELTVEKGMSVEVPLRGKMVQGFVVDVKEQSDVMRTKPIHRLLSNGPVITLELFELAVWIARYYVCPLGKVLKTMLPAGVRKNTQVRKPIKVFRLKGPKELREACIELRPKAPQQAHILDVLLMAEKDGILLSELLEQTDCSQSSIKALVDKGLIALERLKLDDDPFDDYFRTKPKILHGEQLAALERITETLQKRKFETHLLFGVTGSGKTEVYLQAIDKALSLGLGVILLVPEISLTQQTIQHFKSRFDVPLAVLHHRLSDGERMQMWQDIQSGVAKICIGARSSIFCPMQNLGLIIVDEEHEQSYKQTDDSPCYHARDVAVMRAKLANCCCLLGSATPSLESYYNAQNNKYTLSVLTKRPEKSILPQVQIVDMKREYAKAKGLTSFSELLLTKIQERKEKGEQTILFLNRRGYHTVLSCTSCGKSISCPHCDATLTFHKEDKYIACHLCGFSALPPSCCPTCRSQDVIKYQGVGTEKVQAMLHGIFPGIRTVRVDADSTRHKGSLDKLLAEFRSGKADVLIGTQMVAKGLHFPQVTLVGVLNCDGGLQIPDFRAQENVFQLITQVAGRAGRGQSPGEVIIQTALPEHSTIQQAAQQNFLAFYDDEIAIRKAFGFPPFCKVVKFLFVSKDERRVVDWVNQFREALVAQLDQNYVCHPAVPSGHAKIKDQYRYQFLVRGPAIAPIVHAIDATDKAMPPVSSIGRYIDVDPVHTF